MDFDDDRYTMLTQYNRPQGERIFNRTYSIDNLPQREMPSTMYRAYSNWHNANRDMLKASRRINVEWSNVKIVCPEMGYSKSEDLEYFPYGTSTLGKSGCAPFCISQALSFRKKCPISVNVVATELAANGYYFEGRGTWHMALNRLGAKECSNIREIAESLKNKKIVTVLGNGHFRNIIGAFQGYFVISDSSHDGIRFKKIETVLDDTSWAWTWD